MSKVIKTVAKNNKDTGRTGPSASTSMEMEDKQVGGRHGRT